MLKKIKGIGSDISNMATDAMAGVTNSVKEGAGTIAFATSVAATSLSEKAIRTAVEQMRTILQVATEELRQRPVSDRPVTLTASVDIGITALTMQILLNNDTSAAKQGENKDVMAGVLPEPRQGTESL